MKKFWKIIIDLLLLILRWAVSYIAIGSYEVNDDNLILKTDDGKYKYVFKIKEDYRKARDIIRETVKNLIQRVKSNQIW